MVAVCACSGKRRQEAVRSESEIQAALNDHTTESLYDHSEFQPADVFNDALPNNIRQIINELEKMYHLDQYDNYGETRDALSNAYLAFFQTEESLAFKGDGREAYVTSSEDGLIRICSWYTYNYGNHGIYDSLIQYRMADGNLKSIKITQVVENDNESSFSIIDGFGSIYKLKDYVYLLECITGASDNYFVMYITIELKNNEIIPYYAFNGAMKLSFSVISGKNSDSLLASAVPYIIEMKTNFQAGSPFAIELTVLSPKEKKNSHKDIYLKTEDTYKRVERLVFNGANFIGDYSFF